MADVEAGIPFTFFLSSHPEGIFLAVIESSRCAGCDKYRRPGHSQDRTGKVAGLKKEKSA